MTGSLLRRGVASLVCSALVLTSPGAAPYQLFAQEFAQVPRGVAVPGLGSAGAAPAGMTPGAVAPSAPTANPLSSPISLELPVAVVLTPAATPPARAAAIPQAAPKAGAVAESGVRRAGPPARPARGVAAATRVVVEGVAENRARGRFSKGVVERAADAKRPTSGLFRILGRAARGDAKAGDALKASPATLGSAAASKSWSDRIFEFARSDGRAAEETPADVAGKLGELNPNGLAKPGTPAETPAGSGLTVEPAAPKPATPQAAAKPGRVSRAAAWLGRTWRDPARRNKLLAITASIALGTFGFIVLFEAPVFAHPLMTAVGIAGKWVGNVLAIAYPIPQIFRTFREGSSKSTPVKEAVAGTVAPLTQGVVSAPIKSDAFWGVQNLFGAVATFAPLAYGRWLKEPMSFKKAALMTAAVVTVGGALAFGLYFAAASFVPAAAAALMGKALAMKVLVGIQAAAFAGFMYMFLPAIGQILRGEAPKSFTPGTALSFALASVGFVAWMLWEGMLAAPGSGERLWALIYAAQNVALFAVSFPAYFYARRQNDVPTRAARWFKPPVVPGGIYGALVATLVGLAIAPYQPLLALVTPLFGWAIGGVFKTGRLEPDREQPGGAGFIGLAAGILTAAALSTLTAIPVFVLASLPFAGAVIGWRLGLKPGEPIDLREFPADEPVSPADPMSAGRERPAEGGPSSSSVPVPEPVAPAPAAEPARPAPQPAADTPGARAPPRSWNKLPADAKAATADQLAGAAAKAQARARKLAPDARLVRVAINLDDGRAHWIFIFRSDKSRRELTVWQKRIGVAKLGRDEAPAPTLWMSRLGRLDTLETAYRRLKEGKHWFSPARVEIRPRWKGDADFVFFDSRGRSARVAGVAPAPQDQQPPPDPGSGKDPPPGEASSPAPTPPAPETGSGGQAGNGGDQKPPETGAPEAAKTVPLDYKAIHEDFLGFRKVRGLKHHSDLKPLPLDADAPRVQEQISKQFNIPMSKVRDLAGRYRIPLDDRVRWLAVYDRLQKANRAEFANLDSRKYHGWSSFRKLANVDYPEGWRGWALRASELHKHLVGFFFRLWYHLFDSFVFGYFRRAISFRLRHSTEDFLSIPKKHHPKGEPKASDPSKWLEAALSAESFSVPGPQDKLLAKPWVRALRLSVVDLFVQPLAQFLVRRVTLAILSAVAMGVLAGFAPLLPLSLPLTAVPLLGPGIQALAAGVPGILASVPILGPAFAPIVDSAIQALVGDLVLGPMLNTLILTTMLTYPQAFKRRLMDSRGGEAASAPPFTKDWFKAAALTFVSWDFWRDNAKSWFGMVTVGAEIEAVMHYADVVDGVVDQAWQPLTGSQFKLFHFIGAAVERPGDHPDADKRSPIPFGGAITWGSVLLYKAQDLVGFNLTDATFKLVSSGVALFHSTDMTRAVANLPAAAGTAQAIVNAVQDRDGKGPQEWEAELRAAKERLAVLEAQLTGKLDRLKELQAQSKPVTPEERAELERLKLALDAKRLEEYAEGKLGEIHDLKNPKPDTDARLQQLKKLQEEYEALINPPANTPGYDESLSAYAATLKGLAQKLAVAQNPASEEAKKAREPLGTAGQVPPALVKELEDLVTDIEGLRTNSQAELASEQAMAQLLMGLNRIRNAALRERRDGSAMMEFRKNNAKLATVMDLQLGINEAKAAMEKLKPAIDQLNNRLSRIDDARRRAAQGQAGADANRQNLDRWRDEARGDVADSRDQQDSMVELEGRTSMAVTRIQGFSGDIQALLARLDAEDGGSSGNALAEYRRRQALLPSLVEWKTNGKPGDPDYQSVADTQKRLNDVADYLTKIDKGLNDLRNTPANFGGVLILAVPGVPDYTATNPTPDAIVAVLTARKAHWQEQLDKYTRQRDEVRNRLDPNSGGTEVDDFGVSQPISLPKRLAREEARLRQAESDLQTLTSQMDQLAAKVSAAAPGASLPPLSGLSLAQLQEAIEAYPDRFSAVKLPNDDSDATFQAQMDLLSLGKLIPHAGRAVIQQTVADAEITAIRKAMSETLPPIRDGLDQVVETMRRLNEDVDADLVLARRMQGGWAPSAADGQEIIDRKTALLQNARSTVLTAQGFLRDKVLPFVRESIQTYDPNGDKYAKLFRSQIKLYEATQEAIEQKFPWALAAHGGAKGDVAGGLAGIQVHRQKYQKYLDGYDENGVHKKGIREYQLEVQQRKDPNFMGTEERQGELQPFSLPRKIAQYSAERVTRAQQFNREAVDINRILAEIDGLTANRFALASRYSLPADLDGNSEASIDRVQRLVDNRVLQDLGDALTRIGDEYKDKGPEADVGSGEGIPTGQQPPVTIPSDRQVAILALQAARRLVPTTHQGPESDSLAYATARLLYADGAVDASKDALENQIPAAERFLSQGAAALSRAIDNLAVDENYVRSNGTSETSRQVVDRHVAVYRDLNAFTRQGIEFFGLKGQWDQDALNRLDRIQTYYDSTSDIYRNGQTASDSEAEAIRHVRDALQEAYDDIGAKRAKLQGWMNQLNRPEESALKRVAEDLRKIQAETRVVLERNVEYREMEAQHKRAKEILDWTLHRLEASQSKLQDALAKVPDTGALPPALLARLDRLKAPGGAWYMEDTRNASQVLVVPKANFSYFIDQLFAAFKPDASGQNLAGIKNEILANPQSLAQLIPDSKVIDFGDNADGFYLVYQSQFSVPHGLETSSLVTLGNLGKLGGNNISVTGYTFASPANPENAPYGDKGVTLQIESLQGANWVNYFEVDLHRFIQDYPADTTVSDQARQARLRVFEDHAELLFGGKLYWALTGYGDFALDDTWNKPYYYGGSGKVSWKFNEVMSLNAEQQEIWAKDPRWFRQSIDLNPGGWDPDLPTFDVEAKGENKHYRRQQLGPSLDIGKWTNSEDAFIVDLFVARQEGTDDYAQNSAGVSVLKGFTIKDASGKPWVVISNKATGELGQQYNSFTDRVSVGLPNQGLVFSAEGRLIGDAKTYLLEASRKMGDHASMSVSYGSRYLGHNNRLTISMNTAFTLGELWRTVSGNAAEDLAGGETLKRFNAEMNEFYESQADDKMVQQMKAALMRDVGMKLLAQDLGTLSRDVVELRAKGAFMDNSRVRGMVGWVSNPIGDAIGDRLVGGGFTAGTFTESTFKRPPKALIEAKLPELVNTGLRLQERALERIQALQGSIAEVAEAQWQLKLARYAALNGQSPALRAEGEARVQEATLRLDQALIKFNLMTGRTPSEPFPFGDMSAQDLEKLAAELESLVAAPDRVTQILGSLNPDEVKKALGPAPMDLMKWVPWVDEIAVSMGVQLQDMLANQALMLGVRVRLPIYDPASEERDHAYVLESKATQQQILERYQAYALKAERERLAALAAAEQARVAQPRVRGAAQDLRDAIRGYRNGLATEERLRGAFERWDLYQREALRGRTAAALSSGWAAMNGAFAPEPGETSPLAVGSFSEAFDVASKNSRDLAEVAFREQAAAKMTEANSHRIQNVKLDLMAGTGLTADGVGWLPSIGLTGFGVTPVMTFELKPEELRELQVRQGENETELYQALRTQLEINLAVQFYQNASTAKATQAAYWKLSREIIPSLERALADARASAGPGSDRVQKATRELDEAKEQRDQIWLAHKHALATLNYLLGRPPEAVLDVELSPDRALEELKDILAEKKPVETATRILDARVEIARAVETIADKDLKVEQLRLEPVSLVVRSLGRLLNTLSDEGIGNPDLVAASRVNTLQAERAREAYEKGLHGARQRIAAELELAKARRDDYGRMPGPEARLEWLRWANQARVLEAGLASLGAAPAGGRDRVTAPSSFAELQARMRSARESLLDAERPAESQVFEPELLQGKSSMNVRYWFANQSLSKDPINKSYIEGWVEVRLKSQTTPPEVLLALAKLRMDKAERIRKTDLAEARAQADILLSQFETNVRLLRWAERAAASPDGSASAPAPRLAETRRELARRIESQRAVIAALLQLPEGTTAEDLTRLVPADAGGQEADLSAIAARFVADAQQINVEQLRKTVFENGVPEALGNEDSLIHQLRADVIAERMSYKGFTPVVAFGYFRAKTAGGVFMEAPDPRAIEKGLTRVLNDSMRRELISQGRMQELTLRLHLLMTGVQDKSVLLERRQSAVYEAEQNYKATSSRYRAGMATGAELLAAQDSLSRAWTALMSDAASLKNDFIQLVTELEALGYPARDRFAPSPRAKWEPPRLDPQAVANGEFVRYASKRLVDEGFAKRLDERLAALGPGVDPRLRAALAETAARYRSLTESAESIRVSDLPPARKLDLLQKADVEGKRQQLEALLVQTVASLGRLDPRSNRAWGALLQFLTDDVRARSVTAEAEWADGQAVLAEMRQAFWHAVPADPAVEGAFLRLEKLQKAKAEARQELLADYLGNMRSPEEFVMRDLLLDKYLRAEAAYDAALLKAFESAEVRKDRSLALALNAVHGLGPALERQRDAARFGRGMAAIDALIMLERGRLAALRFERGAPSEMRLVASALSNLEEMKDRWKKDPRELKALYAATEVDAEGRRLWTVKGWHTQADVDELKDKRAVKTDDQGRLWLTPASGGPMLELVAGVDIAEANSLRDQAAAEDNARRLSVHETLAQHDFALTRFDGRVRRGLSYEELMNAGVGGRLFHFSNSPDTRTGLRLAVHPLVAFLQNPDKAETVVYVGNRPLSRDMFPTYESLTAHRSRLAASADPDDRLEAERFLIVRTGESGARELLEHAQYSKARSLRAGWIGVKLQGYGFALDGQGNLAELYLAQEDFDRYHEALEDSAGTLARAQAALPKAKDASEAAERESHKLRAEAEAERKSFNKVQEDLENQLRSSGLEGDALKAALYKQKAFKQAQDRMAVFAKAADEADRKAADAHRAYEVAKEAVVEAELLVTRSKSWRLFVSREVRLGFDAEQALVAVDARPRFGTQPLEERFGSAPVKTVEGELLAAVLDEEGRALRLYLDRDAVEKAGESWTIEEVRTDPVTGRPVQWTEGGRRIDPNFRLSHYVDPETGRPVLLSRRFMIDRLSDSQGRLGKTKNWGVQPWQWVDLVLEIPRGIAKTPVELFTGRDPRQEGYLGRVNMYKTEGGMTEHHGFARRVLGVLDILDLLPDPVTSAFDPSQFPKQVVLDDPIRPGENIQGKDARAGNKDVHFGRGHIERSVRYEVEDLVNAKSRVFTFFEGGVRISVQETRRGRAGPFHTSRVSEARGQGEIAKALQDPAIMAGDPSGEEVVVHGDPQHLEVDHVTKRVTVRPGAKQYEETADAMGRYGKSYAERREEDRRGAQELKDAADRSRQALEGALTRRQGVAEETSRLWEELHRLAWRIGRQDALEAEIRKTEAEIARLRGEIERTRARIRELEELLRRKPGDPNNPNDPTNPGGRSNWWAWVLASTILAALVLAIWHWLRRRGALSAGLLAARS